jgi:two-component system, OmpR family, heavy metal sensor histidine kinase CusS
MKSLSLTARLSLLFSASAVLVLLCLGWVVERAVQQHFVEMDRHELEGKLSLVRNLLASVGSAAELESAPWLLETAMVGHHHLLLTVYAADGSVWFSSGATRVPRRSLDGKERWMDWSVEGHDYRGLVDQAASAFAAPFQIALAQDISHHEKFMRDFRETLTFATAIAALMTAILGWMATRTGLRPLHRVAALASSIQASRLDERLPESHIPAEIEALVASFNAMLARLEDSFRRLSEFSSDIAHELRTPVSNLMTQTQVALTCMDASEEHCEHYREILYSSLEEYERMAQMIGDMLFLAQADNGLLKPDLTEVDLAEETRALFEFFEAWTEERGVTLVLNGSAPKIAGDRLMLRRAMSNLLANAIRHTVSGETVSVTLASGDGRIRLSVENPGTEIPAEHLPRLFDRFYRIEQVRSRNSRGEGSGLGLAIVKSIIKAHGGGVKVRSDPANTRFELTFERSEPSQINQAYIPTPPA